MKMDDAAPDVASNIDNHIRLERSRQVILRLDQRVIDHGAVRCPWPVIYFSTAPFERGERVGWPMHQRVSAETPRPRSRQQLQAIAKSIKYFLAWQFGDST